MDDPAVEQKIHHTYRLQYLKDVVLARIIDDPTFSVLNSLIYFNQIEIVQHVQTSVTLLKELFGIFRDPSAGQEKRKNAVLFIQQCCSIAKGLQQPGRTGLFNNFVTAGLFGVITFALQHPEAHTRVAGTEILIALIDHDNMFLRGQIFKSLNEKGNVLTDQLIELLLKEPDLGVKQQMADAIKILLDPVVNTQSLDHMARTNPEIMSRNPNMMVNEYVQMFYDESCKKMFAPLRDVKTRASMNNLTSTESALLAHLAESLCYFLRQHSYRTKTFLQVNELNASVAYLFKSPEKFLKLTALKYFRTCIAMSDPWHWQQMINIRVMEPILDMMAESMPRDNLLNSACLDLFEFIRRVSDLMVDR
jgi:protein phosphatase-4 regulatory subunit 3